MLPQIDSHWGFIMRRRAFLSFALSLAFTQSGCVGDAGPTIDGAADAPNSADSGPTDAHGTDVVDTDGGAGCTPLPPAQAACTGGSPNYMKPQYYFTIGPVNCNNQGSANCYPHATPNKCQCAETYNCGCIFPIANCPADAGYSCTCDDSTGTVVVSCK